MTEPSTDEAPRLEMPIEFMGREIFVRPPSPEQILVWKRTLTQLQSSEVESWNGARIMAALERLRLIIDSLIANPTDIEWIDDEMLAGRIGLRDCAVIVTKAVEAFQSIGNREERRAAKKAGKTPKKAARRRENP